MACTCTDGCSLVCEFDEWIMERKHWSPPLRWSRTPPPTPGWWWTRHGEDVVVVKIFPRPSDGLQVSAPRWFEPLDLCVEFEPNREWAGPIPEPHDDGGAT